MRIQEIQEAEIVKIKIEEYEAVTQPSKAAYIAPNDYGGYTFKDNVDQTITYRPLNQQCSSGIGKPVECYPGNYTVDITAYDSAGNKKVVVPQIIVVGE